MKNIFTILLLSSIVISHEALASNLRVQGLADPFGSTLDGSLYYSDESNIFHNPAELHKAYGNGIYFQEDEGGYFQKNGASHYGIYYGREDRDFTLIRDELGGFSNIPVEKNNPVQFFFSQKKKKSAWGAEIGYLKETSKLASSTKTENISVLKGALGFNKNRHDVFLRYAITGGENSLAAQEKFDGGTNVILGWKYRTPKWNYFAAVKKKDYEFGATGSKEEVKSTGLLAGMGRKLTSKKHLFSYYYSLNFAYDTSESSSTSSDSKTKEYSLPLQLGVEYPLFDWLTLRAGANYLFLRTTETTGDVESKEAGGVLTGPRLGGTINYKMASLDFLYDSGFDQGSTGNDGVEKIGQVALTIKW